MATGSVNGNIPTDCSLLWGARETGTCEIVPVINISYLTPASTRKEPTVPSEEVGHYFRLRFEASEIRYDRMKGLVRAALEKVRFIERENRDLRTAGVLGGLGLQPLHCDNLLSVFVGKKRVHDDALKSSVEALAKELEKARSENTRHAEINQMLRANQGSSVFLFEDPALKAMYTEAVSRSKELAPTVSKLQAQISAMEFDWTQATKMRDELFDYDDKLREHEMVADAVILKRPLPPAEGGKIFATSRRQMLEILVHDRNRNLNGHYARRVVPLEQLRAEKDAVILDLRRALFAYELQFGIISAEAERAKLPALLDQVCQARVQLLSIDANITNASARLETLQQTVTHFEDRVSEWKGAHAEALHVIAKAEKLRSEYDAMMTSLRAEDDRIMSKKKLFEKCGSKADAHDRFDRMRDISAEIDEQDEAVATQEHELSRLKNALSGKKAMLEKEKKAFEQLTQELDRVAGQRKEFEAFLEEKSRSMAADQANGLEEISANLSSVSM
jgi:hypothetical protein